MECKACGAWFSSAADNELCSTCERAMKRLGLYLPYSRLRELVEAYREERYIVLKEPRQAGVHRLSELSQADREGRCVVLPAKTVFELTWDAGPECDMACPVYIDGAGECSFCDKGKLFVYERPCKQEHIERIGVDVFLTRTEAMAALRREQDGNNK